MPKPSKHLKRIRIRIKHQDLDIDEMSFIARYKGRQVAICGKRFKDGWSFFVWG